MENPTFKPIQNHYIFYIRKNNDFELRHWTYADRFNIRRGTGYQNMI